MRFNVLYLARLRDALGCRQEEVELVAGTNVGHLLDQLRARGGPWAIELAPGRAVRVAVNQEMTHAGASLSDGDEVALFPPVTGG